jgi:hypothetical protein
MEHIVATDGMQQCLDGIVEPVEIRDSEGLLLGTFTPNVTPEQRKAYEEAAASFDLEEMRRRVAACKAGQKTRTSEQVLERLRALERGE